jgi:acyl-CoA synthetase (AMP-forming)/AMP-acid ligase II
MPTGAAYTVPDLLLRASEHHHRRIAVVDGERRLTYDALLEEARGYGEALASLGVRRGDRVGMVLPRSANAIAALFGITFAGAVAVPVGERVKHAQVAYTLIHARATAVVTDARHEQLLCDVSPEAVTRLVIAEPGARSGVSNARSRESARSVRRRFCWPPGSEHEGEPPIGKDLALLMYTSGSTGRPKGIMVTHENMTWGAAIVADYLQLTDEDKTVTALPFSFDYGLNQVMTMVHVGGCVVVERSSHPPALCRAIEREGVTGLAGVPLLWQQLADRRSPFFGSTFPSLRYVTNSGGILDPAIVARFGVEKPEVRVFLMYGFTEAFRSTYLDPAEAASRPTSIGRAIPNTEVLVFNEHGEMCALGETGELVHRGPTVAAGYWQDPAATARTFRTGSRKVGAGDHLQDADAEIVAYSGDIVRSDDEGFLYFVGRRDELFKSRGIRLNPEQIEIELRRCDAIEDVIVFTVSNADSGTEPSIVATYVAADTPDPLVAAERFCRSELPAHMRPARFELVSELPATANGKPDRRRARELWGERHRDPVEA